MLENVWVFSLGGISLICSFVVNVAQPPLNPGDFVEFNNIHYKVTGRSFRLSDSARNSYWFDVVKI